MVNHYCGKLRDGEKRYIEADFIVESIYKRSAFVLSACKTLTDALCDEQRTLTR